MTKKNQRTRPRVTHVQPKIRVSPYTPCRECSGLGFKDIPCQLCGKLYNEDEKQNKAHCLALVDYIVDKKPTTVTIDVNIFMWLLESADVV